MGANLTDVAKQIGNLKSKLKKRGIDVESIAPRGYKGLDIKSQQKIYNNLVNARNNYINKTGNTLQGTKRKRIQKGIELPKIPNTGKNPTKLSKNYKKYLDISGLSDSEASRKKFEDIKKLTRLANQIQRSFGPTERNTLNRLANDGRARDRFAIEQINDWTKGRTNLQEVFANVHPYALANCLTDTLHNLEDMISPDYFIHNVLPRLHRSEDVRPAEIIKEFNKLTIAQKVRFNTRVVELYYEKYQECQETGETFNGHTALMEILREI